MLQLLETGRALYVLAGICLLGIITRAITRHSYKRLLKESTNLAMTANKGLRELRQRAENTYRVNQGMRDSASWLENQMYDLRAMGMRLTTWSNLCVQWTWLCLLAGGAGAFFSYWYRLDTYYIVMYGGGAVLLTMFMMMFDNGMAGGLREQLLISLQNQLENVILPKLVRNMTPEAGRGEGFSVRSGVRAVGRQAQTERGAAAHQSERGGSVSQAERGTVASASASGTAGDMKTVRSARRAARQDQSAAAQAGGGKESAPDTEYLKRSLEQLAASREQNRGADENWLKDLKPEEVELIGDILKQYLA